jgi:hypothetical protein
MPSLSATAQALPVRLAMGLYFKVGLPIAAVLVG